MTPIRERPLPMPTPLTPARHAAPSPPRAPHEPDTPPSPFHRLVRGFAKEADAGEATMQGLLTPGKAGTPLDPGHLLALQAGIYRYGETMDLASRLVDKASGAVKTVVQGQ